MVFCVKSFKFFRQKFFCQKFVSANFFVFLDIKTTDLFCRKFLFIYFLPVLCKFWWLKFREFYNYRDALLRVSPIDMSQPKKNKYINTRPIWLLSSSGTYFSFTGKYVLSLTYLGPNWAPIGSNSNRAIILTPKRMSGQFCGKFEKKKLFTFILSECRKLPIFR